MKKREYISERIINISELEKILERERLLIAVLNQELEMELPDMKKVKEIANGISRLHKKASSFEFYIEHRKITKKVRAF